MTVELGAPTPVLDETTVDEAVDQAVQNGEPTPIVRRRIGRPPGSKNKVIEPASPRSVEPGDAAFAEIPVRRRRQRRTTVSTVTPAQIADILVLAHTAAATFVGPAAVITPEDAKKIGDAAVPVLDDFGIQVASRVLHVVILLAAIASVEGPVAVNVIMSQRARVAQMRSGTTTLQGPQQSSPAPQNAVEVARALGIELGQPNTAASV